MLGRRRRRTEDPLADPATTLRLFRALVAAARTRRTSRFLAATQDVENQGTNQSLAVALLGWWLVRRFAYPDWPGGEVDMRAYIGKIRAAYDDLSGLIDTSRVSYSDFARAVGSWATQDNGVEPVIAVVSHFGFLATQWPDADDEPSDEDLIQELAMVWPPDADP